MRMPPRGADRLARLRRRFAVPAGRPTPAREYARAEDRSNVAPRRREKSTALLRPERRRAESVAPPNTREASAGPAVPAPRRERSALPAERPASRLQRSRMRRALNTHTPPGRYSLRGAAEMGREERQPVSRGRSHPHAGACRTDHTRRGGGHEVIPADVSGRRIPSAVTRLSGETAHRSRPGFDSRGPLFGRPTNGRGKLASTDNLLCLSTGDDAKAARTPRPKRLPGPSLFCPASHAFGLGRKEVVHGH